MGRRYQHVATPSRPYRRAATPLRYPAGTRVAGRAARRTRRRRWLLRGFALALLGAEIAALATVVELVRSALPVDAAPAPRPPSAAAVAAHPHAYGGRAIDVAGRVGTRPGRRSDRDRWAFLLMGDE